MTARLNARDEEMERWRKERDTLVSALEVQLKKLIMSNGEKDQQIKMLQSSNAAQTPEVSEVSLAALISSCFLYIFYQCAVSMSFLC